MLRKVASWMLALFWVGAVLLAPSSASWAAEESPSPSVSPSPSATPSEPPAPSEAEPSESPVVVMCGDPDVPCVVSLDEDTQAWLLLASGGVLLLGTALLVSQWGSDS